MPLARAERIGGTYSSLNQKQTFFIWFVWNCWLKVACVVKIKLILYWPILLLFDNTDKLMQNAIQKFRQSSIVSEKPGILSVNLKTLTSCNYPVQYFFAETSLTFSTYHCLQKGMWDFFYFIYILSYLQKLRKTWFLQTPFLRFC